MKTVASILLVLTAFLASCALQPVRHLDDLGEKTEFEKLTEARDRAFRILTQP